jgi:hypothetical protein
MLSRRQLIASALPAAVASSSAAWSEQTNPTHLVLLPADPNAIATESALGYRQLLGRKRCAFTVSNELSNSHFRCLILPGVRALPFTFAARLRETASAGAWLILESGLCFASEREVEIQARVLADVFSLHIDTPRPAQMGLRSGRSYVHYHWPLHALVPDFSEFTPVRHSDADAIATIHGKVVAVRRHIRRGGIVFLGSPLGPGLFAGDRESSELATELVSI